MYIKELIVEYFQSHKAASLKFVRGVNVISGLSHSGKTALLRALTWVIKNRPRGDAFINWDSDRAESIVVFDDKLETTIVRGRGKTANYYAISNAETEPIVFETIDKGVMKTVGDLFNMSDVNIQKQLAPYYLVCEPPGKVATTIREAARLDEIDRTVDVLNGKIRKANINIKVVVKGLTKNKEALEKFDGVDLNILDKAIEKLEELVDAESVLENKVNKLNTTIVDLKAVENLNVSSVDITLLENGIDSGKRLTKVCEEKALSILNLQTSIAKLEKCNDKLKKVDRDISWNEIHIEELMESLVDCPACGVELTDVSKQHLLENSN